MDVARTVPGPQNVAMNAVLVHVVVEAVGAKKRQHALERNLVFRDVEFGSLWSIARSVQTGRNDRRQLIDRQAVADLLECRQHANVVPVATRYVGIGRIKQILEADKIAATRAVDGNVAIEGGVADLIEQLDASQLYARIIQLLQQWRNSSREQVRVHVLETVSRPNRRHSRVCRALCRASREVFRGR